MNNLQLPQAKLLYFIAELWKQKEINDNEKGRLKEMIMGDEPELFEFLEQYEEDSDEQKLKENIIRHLRPEEDPFVVKGSREHNPPDQDELSSPLGRVLLDKKKTHHTHDNHSQLANALKPT